MNASEKENLSTLKTAGRLLKEAGPLKALFLQTVILIIVSSALSPIRPWLIQVTFDDYILTGNRQGILQMTVLIFILLIFESVVQFFQSYRSAILGQNIVFNIRNKLYKHVLKFKMQYFDNTPVGTVVTRVVNDLETIGGVFSEGFIQIIGDLLKIATALVLMFWIDPVLTLVSLIPLPILIIATNIFKNGVNKAFQEVRTRVAELNAFVQEHIAGMAIVQAFAREVQELDKFKKLNKAHEQAHIKSIWYYSIFFPVVEVVTAISIGLAVWWVGRESLITVHPGLSGGKIISFVLYINMLFRPMRQLADRFNTIQMGIIASDRVLRLLDSERHRDVQGHLSPVSLKGEIIFDKVNFAYHDQHWILKNISFHVRPGEKVAIVGPSGSGKTTLINILTRFYPYQSGKILLDGNLLTDYDPEFLRKHIGVVLQDVFLFSGSILDNVRLFDPQISEDDVKAAAQEIGVLEFINRLPGGLHFNVRERGVMLSAGQRQIVSFVRAYVQKPEILILDEATSSLDNESENLIRHATEKITQGRTSVIIAHRLSTIRHADRILVINQGRLEESGSHEELMAKSGLYSKLIKIQYAHI